MSAHKLLAFGAGKAFESFPNMSASAEEPVVFRRYPLPWRWVSKGSPVKLDRKDKRKRVFLAEDHCVIDAAGYEVLGASHFLRVDTQVLEMICRAVNQMEKETSLRQSP